MNLLQVNKHPRRRGLSAALFALATACASVGASASTLAEMSLEERTILVNEMNVSANQVGGKGFFYYEDPSPVSISVTFDVENNVVIVDLDERIGPLSERSETEDLLDSIRFSIMKQYDRVDGLMGIQFLYGGKPSTHWFPVTQLDEPDEDALFQLAQGPRAPIVAISPGHGIYYHHGFKDWRPNRDVVNGVLEDDITPVMASQLASALQRDGLTVHNFRPERNPLTHAPSGQPWWRLGVRYQLAEKLPEHPEIWHAFANAKYALRERDDDIRSRPLYANFLGADAFLHVHTNAYTPDARGARAIIHERAPDRRLAINVLCSMKELIHTKQEFGKYPVPSQPIPMTDKGENKYAKMPSVIVEVGFHTNPQDALLLRNREFQSLAMRGVAKGYRLFRENKPCGDFTIKPVLPSFGRIGYDVHLPVGLAGNPVFPIHVTSRAVNCSGRYCHSRSATLFNQAEFEKYRVQYLCTRNDLGKPPVELSVEAKDADGVIAKPTIYKVACGQ
jgi:N-acetylmuramoyl-L-alanine amidase